VKEYRLHFKSTFQTTPTEGVKNLVAEAPSLEIEKTPLPFKEVIRETPELAQGKRRVVSEGQAGEKVDYIQVSGTNRTLVHSEQRKAQDRIIEVGVKPSISNSKGEEPAPVNEVPEFKGSANFVEAAVNEVPEFKGSANFVEAAVNEVPEFKGGANFVEAAVNEVPEFKGSANFVEAAVNEVPEYTGILATVGDQAVPSVEKHEFKGGVNAVMALEHKLPEYRGILATVGNQPAPTVEKPEFKLSSLEKAQTPEVPVQVAKEDKRLPETGEKQSETAIFLAGVTLALSAALLTAKRKED